MGTPAGQDGIGYPRENLPNPKDQPGKGDGTDALVGAGTEMGMLQTTSRGPEQGGGPDKAGSAAGIPSPDLINPYTRTSDLDYNPSTSNANTSPTGPRVTSADPGGLDDVGGGPDEARRTIPSGSGSAN